jgi:SAM-dependent methyltransferase
MSSSWQDELLALPTENVEQCILCPNLEGRVDRILCRYLALMGPYSALRCPKCGLRWLSPRPDAQGYRLLYSNEGYFGGAGASPANYEAVVGQRVQYFQKRIEKAEAILDRKVELSILDYGAATGEFVALASARGHEVVGIELSDDARAAAQKRLGVELLSPDQGIELTAEFDVIHMNHVLEHMVNPLAHLQWCRRRLRAGGILVLEVPQQFDNDLDRARRALGVGGKQCRFDAYSLHHTYFFDRQTMGLLLRTAGFATLRMRTFNPDKTPLRPVSARSLVLRVFLGLADQLHGGGNIIEVFARRTQTAG